MKQRQYIDFKLLITRPANEPTACQVTLLPTPEVGETSTPVVVPADKGPSTDLLPNIAAKAITLRNLVTFGKGLANWLLPDEGPDDQESIRSLFVAALKLAGNEGGVRLRLIITDPELKRWPWEYVYADTFGTGGTDSMAGFLVLDPRISIVRHEPLSHPHPARRESGETLANLRMVIAAASPKTQAELNVEQEVAYVTEALQNFNIDGVQLTAIPVLDATPTDVAQALQGARSTYLFHFAGHGITEVGKRDPFSRGGTREEGFLYLLEDKATKAESKVRADDLAKLLQASGVRLAVFGACKSGEKSARYPWDGVAGALIRRDIPAVIAMQYEVIDTHAMAFARAFYAALAAGVSLDEAVSAGRLAMYGVSNAELDQQGFLEWGVPVLYSRLPDGQLFPERMEHAGPAAQQLRSTIQQAVDTIAKTGRVVGIEAKSVDGAFEVIQKAGTLEGEMIGLKADTVNTSGSISQEANTVSGSMTGLSLDKL